MKNIVELNTLNFDELENFCFNNFEKMGMYLVVYLLEKYNSSKNERFAIILMKLLDTLASYWEGRELFQLDLCERVLKNNPNSETFLISILTFGLPPYVDEIKKHFDFEYYKNELTKLNPLNPILTKI